MSATTLKIVYDAPLKGCLTVPFNH